jgi:hypothetical protein
MGRGSTAAQLEKICRLVEQLRPRDPAKDEDRRWLRSRDLPNGKVRAEAQLRPEEAARVLAACDVFAHSAKERADALVTMAEATLRGDKPDRPPVVLVHIDAATLIGVAGSTGIPAETCALYARPAAAASFRAARIPVTCMGITFATGSMVGRPTSPMPAC